MPFEKFTTKCINVSIAII